MILDCAIPLLLMRISATYYIIKMFLVYEKGLKWLQIKNYQFKLSALRTLPN